MEPKMRDPRFSVLERGFPKPIRPRRRPQLQLVLHADKCTACGTCLQVCMFDAIEIENGLSVDDERCGLCGACVATCAEGAIDWSRPPSAR